MIKCYVWTVLLYDIEEWTLKVLIMNRIEALEMWIHRRIPKIPRMARKTHEEVLKNSPQYFSYTHVERELLKTVKHRKMSYLGYILTRNRYRILQLILKRRIEG